MRNQKRAEKICRLLPYLPLRQVRNQDALVVHRAREIEARGDLPEDTPQVRRGGDLTVPTLFIRLSQPVWLYCKALVHLNLNCA